MHYEQSEVEGGKVRLYLHTYTVAPFPKQDKCVSVQACRNRSRSPPYSTGGIPQIDSKRYIARLHEFC